MERKIWFAIQVLFGCLLAYILWEEGFDKVLIAINALSILLNATLHYFLDD